MSMTTSGHSQVTVSVDKNGMTKIREALKRGLKMVGMQAESYAKDLCPVKTGNLRNSISHAIRDEGGTVELGVGSNVEYAPYVELGTVKMSARPYLRPAAENHTPEYKAVVESCMKNA